MKPNKPSKTPNPSRVVIEDVRPEVEAGRFPIKRVIGEEVRVRAAIYADGHDALGGVLMYRRAGQKKWREKPLVSVNPGLALWEARFSVDAIGTWEYTLQAWVDRFASWRDGAVKKRDAGDEMALETADGEILVRQALKRAAGSADKKIFQAVLDAPTDGLRLQRLLEPALSDAMARHPDRARAAAYDRILRVLVERERARFGAWYEMFPRSAAAEPGRHGTFDDVIARLPYVASMQFDVLYLPPVHPVGRRFRKGPNNALTAGPDDPGSPWAIGSDEGGHKSLHPQLGTFKDFARLVKAAKDAGLEIALDIAFQCSADHPYLKDHPDWFVRRTDGSIRYAENPPKKYQDIYPLNFECADWKGLWNELKSVFLFWAAKGVRIFRVDNPHTKSFRFWEWVMAEVRKDYPDAVFLSEAFTRPPVLKHLAKAGFSQSYTYFTWRTGKQELADYFTELCRTADREYLRPNLFANTPDILHEFLQKGGPAANRIRFILAATLGATYGIYGPPFELCENTPVRDGSEEYLDSEKYQVRHWDLDRPGNIRPLIAKVNQIRRENPALQTNWGLRILPTDSEGLFAYAKSRPDHDDVIVTVVNVDPFRAHAGRVVVPAAEWGFPDGTPYEVEDLLDGSRYAWRGDSNSVALDPADRPAHIFRLKRAVRPGTDFDYY
jgi:starch synthase (maltosyl-transferring)